MKTSVVDIHKKNGKRPEFDVYIGRSVNGTEFGWSSKWAKPYGYSLKQYEDYIRRMVGEFPATFDLNELKGKLLGCWCITTDKTEPLKCHGQLLMKLIKEML